MGRAHEEADEAGEGPEARRTYGLTRDQLALQSDTRRQQWLMNAVTDPSIGLKRRAKQRAFPLFSRPRAGDGRRARVALESYVPALF